MHKRIVICFILSLLVMQFLPASAYGFCTMYAPDGRTVSISTGEVDAYKAVGWYTEPVTTVYSLDGRTAVIAAEELDAYKAVGWYTTPVVVLYASNDRTAVVAESEADTYRALGWLNTPAVKMCAPDGREIFVNSYDVEAYKAVGWNQASLVDAANLANLSSLKRGLTDEEFNIAYNIALTAVAPVINYDRDAQLLYVGIFIRYVFENGMTYSMTAENYNNVYGYFVDGAASCAGCTRATGLCLNILGIPYEHVNENKYSHQWCRVNVNGEYWICDAYGLYVGPEPAPYLHPYL